MLKKYAKYSLTKNPIRIWIEYSVKEFAAKSVNQNTNINILEPIPFLTSKYVKIITVN